MTKNKHIYLAIISLITSVLASGCASKPVVNQPIGEPTQNDQNQQNGIESGVPGNKLDTSDWQVYQNEELGLAFKYPKIIQ